MGCRSWLLVTLLLSGCVYVQSQEDLNWINLVGYFAYALSSYCSAEKGLTNWTCPWCTFVPIPPLTNVTIFETADAGMGKIYGYVGKSNESIIIAFRGSDTKSNWILDFDFVYRDYPNVPKAFVHAGFYKGYMQVASQITQVVLALQSESPELTVVSTGHSLGAALALLNAAGLAQAGVKNLEVWNFGQPRVGNKEFADYVDSQVKTIYRTINQQDIVPHLPPQDLGYHHVAREVWFPTNYTIFVLCNDSGEDPTCSDSVPIIDYKPQDHLTYMGYGWGGLEPAAGC